MNKLKIYVILSSTRPSRFGEQPAKWIFEKAKTREELDVELIDLRDLKLPFFDEPKSPNSSGGVYENKDAAAWADKVGEADGFIIVTPEYNHGYPAVLKNALDYVYKQWNNKPVAFVSYGTAGGARSVEQLRQVVVELQMTPIRAAVHIVAPWNLLDENNKLITESFEKAGDGLLDQLIWWAKALAGARADLINSFRTSK